MLLDPVEIKWANGVHLFAPFNWSLLDFGFVWPESLLIDSLTLFGLIYFIWNWKRAVNTPAELDFRNPKRYLFSVLLLSIYFTLPLALLDSPRNADNHFVKTLSNENDRTGSYLELDRRFYKSESKTINTFANEDLNVEGINLDHSAVVSVRAKFINNHTLQIIEFHEHNAAFRDGASYLALLLITIMWIITVIKSKFNSIKG